MLFPTFYVVTSWKCKQASLNSHIIKFNRWRCSYERRMCPSALLMLNELIITDVDHRIAWRHFSCPFWALIETEKLIDRTIATDRKATRQLELAVIVVVIIFLLSLVPSDSVSATWTFINASQCHACHMIRHVYVPSDSAAVWCRWWTLCRQISAMFAFDRRGTVWDPTCEFNSL